MSRVDDVSRVENDVSRAAAVYAPAVADLAASFQEAVADCLVGKAIAACWRFRDAAVLCVGGGVAANSRLRERMAAASAQDGFELHIAPPALCTDNAVMGAIAIERWKAGLVEPLDLDAFPGVCGGDDNKCRLSLRVGWHVPEPKGEGRGGACKNRALRLSAQGRATPTREAARKLFVSKS